ncbi:hypothetical protein [Methanosarcina mazei]|uniref:Uncharacterized protein n=1 Tax=Methanosarcina mazei TaxID=2209 RepID=A0A0F8I188_METMZ|nr:hypothetical protein [Methanosarcina mazei]KKG73832.1 hypothetical protein DU46_08550 [Methanosarcina mazei]KKG77136.1 hypothetical protein DU61_07030 [Methanosarcina mazei]KKG83667.1 hypothetical protein DU55_04255 [Methanosarcina mazei]KKH11758.1 hypothetical protein DU51_10435 [Methanosarcina mazei]KKH13970.1 hypothetical protein DU62_07755 [Methanosarcina mazei]
MKAVLLLLILFLISFLPASVAAENSQAGDTGPARITELYSDIESFGVTIHSTRAEEDLTLEVTLVRPERGREMVIATQEISTGSFPANTRVMKVGLWEVGNLERGAYTLKAKLLDQGQVLSESEYGFAYGARSATRVQVNDLVPNSEGITVVLSPTQPSLFDIEYMLIDGHDVIFRTKTEKLALTSIPEAFSATWGSILENNKEYMGRVKIQVYSPNREFIASTERFTARDDAEITDVYEDETGASATVLGRSQVPFEGSLVFSVYELQGISGHDSPVFIESARERVPVLLNDDDETVEVAWRERLTEGVYRLVIELVGNDGDIIERRETIIQSTLSPASTGGAGQGTGNETPSEDSGNDIPGFSVVFGIAGLIIGFALFKKLH